MIQFLSFKYFLSNSAAYCKDIGFSSSIILPNPQFSYPAMLEQTIGTGSEVLQLLNAPHIQSLTININFINRKILNFRRTSSRNRIKCRMGREHRDAIRNAIINIS